MWTIVQQQQIRQLTQQVLHVPGNFTKEVLEMAIVFDMEMPKDKATLMGKQLVQTLKATSEVFRNVRLNAVRWYADDTIKNDITAMPLLQLGRYFDTFEQVQNPKNLDYLLAYLKTFQARAKLIFVMIEQKPAVRDMSKCNGFMKPFLDRKTIWLLPEAYQSDEAVSLLSKRCIFVSQD